MVRTIFNFHVNKVLVVQAKVIIQLYLTEVVDGATVGVTSGFLTIRYLIFWIIVFTEEVTEA